MPSADRTSKAAGGDLAEPKVNMWRSRPPSHCAASIRRPTAAAQNCISGPPPHRSSWREAQYSSWLSAGRRQHSGPHVPFSSVAGGAILRCGCLAACVAASRRRSMTLRTGSRQYAAARRPNAWKAQSPSPGQDRRTQCRARALLATRTGTMWASQSTFRLRRPLREKSVSERPR